MKMTKPVKVSDGRRGITLIVARMQHTPRFAVVSRFVGAKKNTITLYGLN